MVRRLAVPLGTSSAPLPDGVPARPQSSVYGDGSIPQQPSDASRQPAHATRQPSLLLFWANQVQQPSSQPIEEAAGEVMDESDGVAKVVDVAPGQSVEDGEEAPRQAIPLPPISEDSPEVDDAGKKTMRSQWNSPRVAPCCIYPSIMGSSTRPHRLCRHHRLRANSSEIAATEFGEALFSIFDGLPRRNVNPPLATPSTHLTARSLLDRLLLDLIAPRRH